MLMDPPQNRFQLLLEQHRGIVFKVAGTYCRDDDDRRDLAQEIAVQLWRAFPRYDPERRFSTWMYRIALNVAISYVRRTSTRHRHVVPLDPAHDVAVDDGARREADAQVRALYAVIDRLNPLDRALLLLYLEDRSQREIAEVLGLTETNVATKLGRLKQRLRRDLAQPEEP
jgi:RNA polymerase sigma-70 factor, ECF subfamily